MLSGLSVIMEARRLCANIVNTCFKVCQSQRVKFSYFLLRFVPTRWTKAASVFLKRNGASEALHGEQFQENLPPGEPGYGGSRLPSQSCAQLDCNELSTLRKGPGGLAHTLNTLLMHGKIIYYPGQELGRRCDEACLFVGQSSRYFLPPHLRWRFFSANLK